MMAAAYWLMIAEKLRAGETVIDASRQLGGVRVPFLSSLAIVCRCGGVKSVRAPDAATAVAAAFSAKDSSTAAVALITTVVTPRVAATTDGSCWIISDAPGEGGMALIAAAFAFALRAIVFDTPNAKYGRRFLRTLNC
jgi:hypothetical protein